MIQQTGEIFVALPSVLIKNLSCKKGDVSHLHVPYKVNRLREFSRKF